MKPFVFTRPKLRPARACARAVALAAAMFASSAQAWTCNWTGAVNSSGSNAANWNCIGQPGLVPGNGDDLVFPDTAANKTYTHDFGAPPPVFGQITFQSGYTVGGSVALRFMGDAVVSAPFDSQVLFSSTTPGSHLDVVDPTQGTGPAYFANVAVPLVRVGLAPSTHASAVLGTAANQDVLVGPGGRVSMASTFTAGQVLVYAGGTIAVSDPAPGSAPGTVIGSATVLSEFKLSPGAVLEYRAYPPGSFLPGSIAAQSALVVDNAELRVVLDDPTQPPALGAELRVFDYPSGTGASRFAGKPEGQVFAAANASGVFFRIAYGSPGEEVITLTRVAAPPPGPGGPAAIPALAPTGLALLSAAMAGVGLLRRRKRG